MQVPIVASTGGLVNTVLEGYTGFQMGAFNVEVILRSFQFIIPQERVDELMPRNKLRVFYLSVRNC